MISRRLVRTILPCTKSRLHSDYRNLATNLCMSTKVVCVGAAHIQKKTLDSTTLLNLLIKLSIFWSIHNLLPSYSLKLSRERIKILFADSQTRIFKVFPRMVPFFPNSTLETVLAHTPWLTQLIETPPKAYDVITITIGRGCSHISSSLCLMCSKPRCSNTWIYRRCSWRYPVWQPPMLLQILLNSLPTFQMNRYASASSVIMV